jgi:UDP-glucuronate 4-epimerase
MNILVTGSAGFIGARTCELLLDAGHRVVGVDNLNDYYDVRLKQHRLDKLRKNTDFNFFKVDLEHKDALDVLFMHHKFDAVINLGARAGVRYSVENPYVYMMTNAQGTLHLLENMRQHGIKKMVLASTSSLYAGQPTPFSEDLPVNTPISTYAASKKAAEVLAYGYHHLFDLDISILRYFTVYGPAGRPDMSIYRFIKWIDEGTPLEIFGDGSQCRDFTYVDDIARGTIMGLKPLGYEVINLGGGRIPVTMNAVITMLERMLGKKAVCVHKPFHKADINETAAAIEKAGRLLGWKAEVDLETGLQRTVDWYLKNREWLKTLRFE